MTPEARFSIILDATRGWAHKNVGADAPIGPFGKRALQLDRRDVT